MKYKLLQNLPWINKWSIFTEDWYVDSWCVDRLDYEICADMIKKLFNNKDWFEPVEEKKEFASNGMYIWDKKWSWSWLKLGDDEYTFRYDSDAILFTEKLLALRTIWKWKTENDWDFEPDWNNDKELKFFMDYCYNDKDLNYNNWTLHSNDIPFLPYYSSEEMSLKACEELKEEYLLLLTK